MSSAIRDFGAIAQRLARNPLGIIALFIVLIYALAVLLVGVSGEKLTSNERLPLVWFIVVFPFVVLFAFFRLVANHHSKLYAPSDYRDERLFFHPLTLAEQEARIKAEVDELETETASVDQICESAPVPGPKRVAIGDYLLAEELALRQLEAELHVPLTRQVGISALPGVMFDALASTSGQLVFAEVKTARQPLFSPNILRTVYGQFEKARTDAVQRGLASSFRLFLLVVADMSNENQRLLEENLSRFISVEAPELELRIYSLAGLRRRFGVEAS